MEIDHELVLDVLNDMNQTFSLFAEVEKVRSQTLLSKK